MTDYLGDLQLTNWLFQRCLAALYLIGFIVAFEQFPALLGEKGLLPAPDYIKAAPFAQSPSIFYWFYSDTFLRVLSAIGIVLSVVMLAALPEAWPWWASLIIWLVMYVIYLSINNVGQRFYGFGWESMLLEAGFFAAFLGPASLPTPVVPMLILRWMLFRVELGAGLIKLRHDECWRDLTCLYYHHETQPLPNPLSWLFHRLPKVSLRAGVLFSHLVQVVMPFFLFAPQPIAGFAGLLIVAHQMLLIVAGNYSWLNWLTVVLGITAFSDGILGLIIRWHPQLLASHYPAWHHDFMNVLLGVAVVLSIQPTLNLFSRNQLMNFSYNPLHLINTYGAFGSMSRDRLEIVIEGTTDEFVGAVPAGSSAPIWKEYEFRAKPGDVKRMPPQVAPYHLRLDWLMWFIPFSITVRGANSISHHGYELWFMRFIQKLLQGDRAMLRLLGRNPFPDSPPMYVRARCYMYKYTSWKERNETHAWWERTLIDDYLPPVRLTDIESALHRGHGGL
jgi:hypothetical protein